MLSAQPGDLLLQLDAHLEKKNSSAMARARQTHTQFVKLLLTVLQRLGSGPCLAIIATR